MDEENGEKKSRFIRERTYQKLKGIICFYEEREAWFKELVPKDQWALALRIMNGERIIYYKTKIVFDGLRAIGPVFWVIGTAILAWAFGGKILPK